MDTSNREVSWLDSFPPDIWAYIVWHLPGEQLGRLMMTGATLLWRRLKSPVVVKSIKLGEDFIVFKSWPRFLNAFPSLDELCIHSCRDDWCHGFGLMFESIPSGVRKLELKGDWSKSVPKLFPESDGALQLYKLTPHLAVLDLSTLMFASYSWMAHTPQSLTDLSLYHWNGTVELPSSLIHFKVNVVDLSTPSSMVSKLPPSLESFVVTSSLRGVDLVVPLLPCSSRKLDLGDQGYYSDGHRDSRNFLEQLPKALTWLKVPSSTEISFVTNPELISLLASTLTELVIILVLPSSAWPLLPPQLVKLEFRAPDPLCTVASTIIDEHGTRREIPSIPFDSLPRSITSLALLGYQYYFCGPPAACTHSYFPPQLTYLKIPQIQLSEEAAKLLPSSLLDLEIGSLCERSCEHLPNGLKTLKSNATLMSPNLIKFLPKSLVFLQLSMSRACDCWFDYITGETIDPVSKLPEYSIHKNCVSPSFDWKDFCRLPAKIVYIDIFNAHELGDSFLLHQQLPNLLRLDLGDSSRFTDLSIRHLSPHLTTLNLQYSHQISGKSFEFLPRHLTYVNLNSSESIFDSDIQHLPRTLKVACLNHAIHLTDLCISDLPPHLEKLSMMYNSKITQSSVPNFPSALRSSQINRSVGFSNWYMRYGEIFVLKKKKRKGHNLSSEK